MHIELGTRGVIITLIVIAGVIILAGAMGYRLAKERSATAQRKLLASERAELRGFRREQDVREATLSARECEQYQRELELNAREDALDERDRDQANRLVVVPLDVSGVA